jgi:hypothetical protein
MRRTFGVDVLACARCGERLRLVALIERACVIERISGTLGCPPTSASRGRQGATPRRSDLTSGQSQEAPEFNTVW